MDLIKNGVTTFNMETAKYTKLNINFYNILENCTTSWKNNINIQWKFQVFNMIILNWIQLKIYKYI